MTIHRTLLRECTAEVVGTFVLVFFGVGSVHAAVLTGAQQGLWQVAVVWGVAISLAIYAVGAVSGAHINPAVTVAFALYRKFPWRKVGPYVLAQLVGAFVAAAVLYGLFANAIADVEAAHAHAWLRGQAGSELTAMCFGEYFPNPALFPGKPWIVNELQAMAAEGLGTAFLAFFVFAVTEARNIGSPARALRPLFIGLAVSILISILAPLTQAGLNPARDFGPRLFAFLAGWGRIAIPGPRGGCFTVYILAPILGAAAGAGAYNLLLRPALPQRENKMNRKVRLILIGGFLGAGKTTLLAALARKLVGRGERVGLITNDQAADLVDTAILRDGGLAVSEIAGGCFCCRFQNLITAGDELIAKMNPDTLIGEPVGSCTDLSATVLQPIKKLHGDRFAIAPFAVLADPARLAEALEGSEALSEGRVSDTEKVSDTQGAQGPTSQRRSAGVSDTFSVSDTGALPASVTYIFRKQLEEADLIVINKADLLAPAELARLRERVEARYPGRPLRTISALTGQGVDELLEQLSTERPAGRYVADVDYDTYAEGEALLGWSNSTVTLRADREVDWRRLCEDLLADIRARLAAERAEIAHLKLYLHTAAGALTGNLTSSRAAPAVRGTLAASAGEAELTINARVHLAPERLRAVVEAAVHAMAADRLSAAIARLTSFRPSRPTPVHRFSAPV